MAVCSPGINKTKAKIHRGLYGGQMANAANKHNKKRKILRIQMQMTAEMHKPCIIHLKYSASVNYILVGPVFSRQSAAFRTLDCPGRSRKPLRGSWIYLPKIHCRNGLWNLWTKQCSVVDTKYLCWVELGHGRKLVCC